MITTSAAAHVAEREHSALRDLGGLHGLPALLDRAPFTARDPREIPAALHEVLGVPSRTPVAATTHETWTRDGVDGTLLTWDVGFGARTAAWLLRPAGETAPLPGIVALHCHGGMKRYGKEKIADGPGPVPASIARFRDECYSGRAVANEFARAGNAVLVHDVFGWGSRRAAVADMPWRSEHVASLELAERRRQGEHLDEAAEYDVHAGAHEDAVAKTLGVLGTSWGGVVVREDLIAADVLGGRSDVRSGGVTFVGMSGGGARAVLATALSDSARAAAVIAMMSTFDELLDGYLHTHTWMMMNPGIGRVADWTDIAAARAPRPLFVGYAHRDALFSAAGMDAADARLRDRYHEAGAPDAYTAHGADAPHSFDAAAQAAFLRWHRELIRENT